MSVGRLTVVIMADVAVPVPGIRSVPLTELDFTVVDVETGDDVTRVLLA